VERVGSGLEVERHHAAACNGALRIQAAGLACTSSMASMLGRRPSNRRECWPCQRCRDRVFLGKILASVDYAVYGLLIDE